MGRSNEMTTTVQARPSGAVRSGAAALGILWVHPTSLVRWTPLRRARTVCIGRSDDADILLPNAEVSRRHAEIESIGPVFALRDLNSRNGVFVDGIAVKEKTLDVGQVVRLGDCIGIVTFWMPEEDREEGLFEVLAPGVAGGPVLRSVLRDARRAAESSLPVVITGATGTGKEGCARALHDWSGRKGPFLAINCAAIAESLIEAELFGYRKGAFTGAERASLGHFRAAHQGTLLLDELADLPLGAQAKLLRVLEQSEVVPVGESLPVPVDVRVLAATQVRLREAAAEGRVRPDLCARLEGITVELPPLRARKEEIAYLFSYLLSLHAGGRPPQVEARLVEELCLYDWPFNIRELDLLTRRLLVLHAHEGTIRRSHLPEYFRGRSVSPGHTEMRLQGGAHAESAQARERGPAMHTGREPPPNTPEAHRQRRQRELAALRDALREHAGNVARAARAAGISRQRAYRLMDESESDDGVESRPVRPERRGR